MNTLYIKIIYSIVRMEYVKSTKPRGDRVKLFRKLNSHKISITKTPIHILASQQKICFINQSKFRSVMLINECFFFQISCNNFRHRSHTYLCYFQQINSFHFMRFIIRRLIYKSEFSCSLI